MKQKSFIVTGASATGKSTLINTAVDSEYIYLPTHMTRKPRQGEINGKDAIFISKEEFEKNFMLEKYIEESLDFALLKSLNVYYGTPKIWLTKLLEERHCASPVSTAIAAIIKEKIDIIWIHLHCNEEDRYNRLISRGISEEEVQKRLTSGDSIIIPEKADLIVNTSLETPQEILKRVRIK